MAGSLGSKYYNVFLDYRIHLSQGSDDIIINDELFNILNQIKNEGSLINAAEKAEISFRKAWNLIKKAETKLGFVLVDRQRGGASGGCSHLTEEGSKLLDAYQQLVVEFDQSIYNVTKKFFKTINS